MKNQIIGVKYLHTDKYQDLLNAPTLLSLTAEKTYAYISAGFDVQINDLVIVPNSGYNDTPVIPAVVAKLDDTEGLSYATKPILAVIPQDSFALQELYSLDVYKELRKRDLIENQLNEVYERAVKMKKIRKLAKNNSELADLLQQLDEQNELIDNLNKDDVKKEIPDDDDYF